MRKIPLLVILVLAAFLAEVLLDPSTSFVRSYAPLDTRGFTATPGASLSSGGPVQVPTKKGEKSRKVVLGCPAHAAVPVSDLTPAIDPFPRPETGYSRVFIPHQAPAPPRLERPPIA